MYFETRYEKVGWLACRMGSLFYIFDILSDIKEAKLGSKAVDYISGKVKQSGYGKRTKPMKMMRNMSM